MAIVFSVVLAIVETYLNWGDWQYAPLWIVDYMINSDCFTAWRICLQAKSK